MRQSLGVCVYVNTFIAVALSLCLFVAPAAIIVHDLHDPGLRGGPIPRCAWALSPKYERQFWQQGTWFAGFREYPRDIEVGWFTMNDVDAGPVLGGYGVATSAFGIGAARAMGGADHAYQLAAQALVASWPLPDGSLLVPRVPSNMSDAPYLGEAATLFTFTRPARRGGNAGRVLIAISLICRQNAPPALLVCIPEAMKRPRLRMCRAVMTLYITENCDTCTQIRELLDQTAMAHETIVVPAKEAAERLPEGKEPPVLVDDGRVVQGSLEIFAYIEELEVLKQDWLKYQSDVCYCD